MTPEVRSSVLQRIHQALKVDEVPHLPEFALMDEADIAALERSQLVTLGGHTVNHEILSNLDDQSLDREVSDSIAAIGRMTTRCSRTFAYPNGTAADFDERAQVVVRREGCSAAGHFQKILLDPPRSGAGQVLPLIAASGATRVVYVSCNPETLGEDAGKLVHEYGFRLKAAGIMDMFPQTSHIESMALFERETQG